MLDSLAELLGGLLCGGLLGFLLQKGRASRHDVVVGQLLLRDWTYLKVFATAVAVGAIGVWTMVALGRAPFLPPPAELASVCLGALLFGVGVAILGYCPATAIVALGEGKRDARFGVLGMAAGGTLYVITYDWVAPLREAIANWGPITWPAMTRSSPWLWVGLVVLIAGGLYVATRLHIRAARRRT